ARSADKPTEFVGYEATESESRVAVTSPLDGRLLVKLEESPFYAEGGGQVSDMGVVETPSGRAHVDRVYRLGDDQVVALVVDEGEIGQGETARAMVDRDRRLATMSNHTATHLLHAALRETLGTHVRQAGSYVGPDKLRFDFTHGSAPSPDERRTVEDRVNEWIPANQPAPALTTSADAARPPGATAVLTASVETGDDKALLALTDQLASKLGDAAVVLGSAPGGRPRLVAVVTPSAVEKGVKAGSVIKAAASLIGGGGGGRDTMARAGG